MTFIKKAYQFIKKELLFVVWLITFIVVSILDFYDNTYPPLTSGLMYLFGRIIMQLFVNIAKTAIMSGMIVGGIYFLDLMLIVIINLISKIINKRR